MNCYYHFSELKPIVCNSRPRGAESCNFFDSDSQLRSRRLYFFNSDSRLRSLRSGFFASDSRLRLRGLIFSTPNADSDPRVLVLLTPTPNCNDGVPFFSLPTSESGSRESVFATPTIDSNSMVLFFSTPTPGCDSGGSVFSNPTPDSECRVLVFFEHSGVPVYSTPTPGVLVFLTPTPGPDFGAPCDLAKYGADFCFQSMLWNCYVSQWFINQNKLKKTFSTWILLSDWLTMWSLSDRDKRSIQRAERYH